MRKWRVLASQEIVANRWIRVHQDQCLTERGNLVETYFVVEKPDFALIVAITKSGELLLVRQYKHPVREVVVECPAGHVDAGEEAAAAAVRELREETGYVPGTVRKLGAWRAAPGTLNNMGHLFLITDAEWAGRQQLDACEDVELIKIDFKEAVRRVADGELVDDVPSVAAIMLANQVLFGRPANGEDAKE